jgi:hypothetical protein
MKDKAKLLRETIEILRGGSKPFSTAKQRRGASGRSSFTTRNASRKAASRTASASSLATAASGRATAIAARALDIMSPRDLRLWL